MIRDTSVDAFHTIKNNGLLSNRRLEVYEILFHHGPLTAHEVVAVARAKYPVANQTGFNARLSELESVGVVRAVGEKINPVSGHLNALWDVTPNLPIKFERSKEHKCPTCRGTGKLFTEQGRLF